MDLSNIVGNFLHYGISFVAIISIIVFIHEYGHFAVARFFGVKVDEFSIGFGKELKGWTDKHGTRWKISLLPLGGFVKMHGDEDASSKADAGKLKKMSENERSISFFYKPLWQKALIVAAGPAINFLLAILIYSSIYATYGKTEIEFTPAVGVVIEGGVADELGIEVDDLIVSIGGAAVETFQDVREKTMLAPSVATEIVVNRGGELKSFSFVPENQDLKDETGEFVQVRLGIKNKPDQILRKEEISFGVFEAIGASVQKVYDDSVNMLNALGQIITGERSMKEMGGPVKIVEYSGHFTQSITDSISCAFGYNDTELTCGELAQNGILNALIFMAMISTMLGLMNLLPVPMLDGGHLLFYGIEAIIRRPVPEMAQEWSFRAGFAFLIGIMLYVTYNDIISLVNRFIL